MDYEEFGILFAEDADELAVNASADCEESDCIDCD